MRRGCRCWWMRPPSCRRWRILRRFIAEGADLVAFSGGKAINGPQGSGFLCGRRDLVGAALLQQLDLDYVADEWEPPRELIDRRNLPGLPRHGIARSCKTGKEQIVGALTAFEALRAGKATRAAVTASRRSPRHWSPPWPAFPSSTPRSSPIPI